MDKELKGLGGWLILVQIGFYLSILMTLEFLIFPYGKSVINLLQQIIAIPSFVTIIFYSLIALFFSYSLFLMYYKKKNFVNFAIFSLWYSFVINAILLLVVSRELVNLYFALMSAILWTIYLKKSKRVQNTFIK